MYLQYVFKIIFNQKFNKYIIKIIFKKNFK